LLPNAKNDSWAGKNKEKEIKYKYEKQ